MAGVADHCIRPEGMRQIEVRLQLSPSLRSLSARADDPVKLSRPHSSHVQDTLRVSENGKRTRTPFLGLDKESAFLRGK